MVGLAVSVLTIPSLMVTYSVSCIGSSINYSAKFGQGVRLQPLYRMGAACYYREIQVSLCVRYNFVNTTLKTTQLPAVVTGYSPVTLAPTVTAVASEKLKVVCDGAEEAIICRFTTAIHYRWWVRYVSESRCKGNILKAAFNDDVQTQATAGDVVYVLCVAADGTLSEIKSATILQ